jgi:inositol 1,4,5-triphosphate receptor type 1
MLNYFFFLSISIADKRMTEAARNEMDELNIKCLQVLRAAIYNEERKMDEDWEVRTAEHKIIVQIINSRFHCIDDVTEQFSIQ